MPVKILTFLLILTILLCFSGRTAADPVPGLTADDPEIPRILSAFGDVDAGAWYAQSAAFLYNHGVLRGTGAHTFSPEESMTRAMLATALYRHAGCPALPEPHTFEDVPSQAWYEPGAAWVWEAGLMDCGDRFDPNEPVSAADCLSALSRYAGAEEEAAAQWARTWGLPDSWPEMETVTRAQAAVLLAQFCQNCIAAP